MPGTPFGSRAEPRRAGLSVLEELGSHLPEDLEVVIGELDGLGEALFAEGSEGVENEGPVLCLREARCLQDVIQAEHVIRGLPDFLEGLEHLDLDGFQLRCLGCPLQSSSGLGGDLESVPGFVGLHELLSGELVDLDRGQGDQVRVDEGHDLGRERLGHV